MAVHGDARNAKDFKVYTTSIIEEKRIPNGDRIFWADHFDGIVKQIARNTEPPFALIQVLLNNLSLVYFRTGLIDDARMLCTAQIDWDNANGFSSCVVQPIVNLARISFAQGDYAGAIGILRRFENANRYYGPLDSILAARSCAGERDDFLTKIEIWKNLYKTEEYRDALYELDSLRSYEPAAYSPGANPLYEELRMATLIAMGDISGASLLFKQLSRSDWPFVKLTFTYYQARLSQALGDLTLSRRLVSLFIQYLRNTRIRPTWDHRFLRLVGAISMMAKTAAAPEQADARVELFSEYSSLSRQYRDLYQLDVANNLLRGAGVKITEEHQGDLVPLERDFAYEATEKVFEAFSSVSYHSIVKSIMTAFETLLHSTPRQRIRA